MNEIKRLKFNNNLHNMHLLYIHYISFYNMIDLLDSVLHRISNISAISRRHFTNLRMKCILHIRVKCTVKCSV